MYKFKSTMNYYFFRIASANMIFVGLTEATYIGILQAVFSSSGMGNCLEFIVVL